MKTLQCYHSGPAYSVEADSMNRFVIGAILGAFAGAFCMLLCLAVSWQLGLFPALLLGGLTGGGMWLCLREQASPAAGFTAAGITLLILIAARSFESQSRQAESESAAASEDSYIEAVAEGILQQRAINAHADEAEFEPVMQAEPLPAEVLSEARRQWETMPEKEKEEVRKQRQRWMAFSHEEGSAAGGGSSWGAQISSALLAAILAMTTAAWPALARRFRAE